MRAARHRPSDPSAPKYCTQLGPARPQITPSLGGDLRAPGSRVLPSGTPRPRRGQARVRAAGQGRGLTWSAIFWVSAEAGWVGEGAPHIILAAGRGRRGLAADGQRKDQRAIARPRPLRLRQATPAPPPGASDHVTRTATPPPEAPRHAHRARLAFLPEGRVTRTGGGGARRSPVGAACREVGNGEILGLCPHHYPSWTRRRDGHSLAGVLGSPSRPSPLPLVPVSVFHPRLSHEDGRGCGPAQPSRGGGPLVTKW
jgi:hypothetical protein